MKFKYKVKRPKRMDLYGLSASEFKTKLKRAGHTVPRDFYRSGCISKKGGKVYRWRWWSTDEPIAVVDIANRNDFDRWANSVIECVPFNEVIKL